VSDDDQNGAVAGTTRGVVRAAKPVGVTGIRQADFIRASGHRAASTGSTHDRNPNDQKLKSILASPEPSTHDNALLLFIAVQEITLALPSLMR
jgi:hypothetical protein